METEAETTLHGPIRWAPPAAGPVSGSAPLRQRCDQRAKRLKSQGFRCSFHYSKLVEF